MRYRSGSWMRKEVIQDLVTVLLDDFVNVIVLGWQIVAKLEYYNQQAAKQGKNQKPLHERKPILSTNLKN